MLSLLNPYVMPLSSMAGLTGVLLLAFLLRYKIFWLMDLWYSLPIIGKLKRLSSDNTRSSRDQSWTNAERTLCHHYKQFIHPITASEFDKRLIYLSKAHDLGRTPLPGWLILLLLLLLIAEGLGFSLTLSTWAARDGSTNMQEIVGIAIVLVLCVILLFCTHSAGYQLYRTSLVRRCEKEWRDDGQPGEFTSAIRLNEDQSKDDKQPTYTQCINRVGVGGNYLGLGGVIILILLIAGLSTWMRMKHLEGELTQETAQIVNPYLSSGGLLVPGDVSKPQQEADDKAIQDSTKTTNSEGLAAFIMLALIFVATQAVAISAGYRWGFAGKESGKAYEATQGFSTYDDYQRFCDRIIQVAQAKLQLLQQRLMGKKTNQNLRLHHTFDDFLIEDKRPATVRANDHQKMTGATPKGTAQVATELGIDNLLAQYQWISQSDKDSRRQFIKSIQPDALKEQFIQMLKERKETDAKRKDEQEDRELEELV